MGRGGRILLELGEEERVGSKNDGEAWCMASIGLWLGGCQFSADEERYLQRAICVRSSRSTQPVPVIIFPFHIQARKRCRMDSSLSFRQMLPRCLNHDIKQYRAVDDLCSLRCQPFPSSSPSLWKICSFSSKRHHVFSVQIFLLPPIGTTLILDHYDDCHRSRQMKKCLTADCGMQLS